MANITGQHAIMLTKVSEGALTKRYTVKKGSGANGIVACDATSVPLGIVADSATGAGEPLPVVVFGECECISGASFAAGAWLGSDASGKLVALATGAYPVGIALEEATGANQYVKVFVMLSGLPKA